MGRIATDRGLPAPDLPNTFDWVYQTRRLVLPGGIVAYGKTGARHGYAAGVGATRDLSRTVVYSVNSTDAKASGQSQRTLGIALAAFA
jgi:D-alanyl-D-alanine carboxypeptidase